MKNIEEIINNTKEIMVSDHSLSILLDFERVISEFGVYAFKNWFDGELVEGPKIEKYHVTCVFMWGRDHMPDPDGAKRLLNHDCEITFKKSKFVSPVKIKTPDDYRPGTKFARLEKRPVWLVSITIPKKLMENIDFSMLPVEEDEEVNEFEQENIQNQDMNADFGVENTGDEEEQLQK